MGALVDHIMAAAHHAPQAAGYLWPSPDKSAGGCMADLRLGTDVVLRAGKGSYCCGVTLEWWWRGWEAFAGKPPVTLAEARDLQRDWFCIGTRRGCADALVKRGLGVEVPASQAQKGDFAQLWRPNRTGHTVLVLSIARGRISYLSTQASTNGVGARVETVPPEIYVVRPAEIGVRT